MAYFIRVYRCTCGKMHCTAGVSEISRCTCGLPIYPYIWRDAR